MNNIYLVKKVFDIVSRNRDNKHIESNKAHHLKAECYEN